LEKWENQGKTEKQPGQNSKTTGTKREIEKSGKTEQTVGNPSKSEPEMLGK
jgi:hypothetical protein